MREGCKPHSEGYPFGDNAKYLGCVFCIWQPIFQSESKGREEELESEGQTKCDRCPGEDPSHL